MFIEVALPLPLRTTFSYGVPDHLVHRVARGKRVLVPFRNQSRSGIVMSVSSEPPAGNHRIRNAIDVVDQDRFIPEPQLRLCEWIARYYHTSIGEAVDLAVPSSLQPERSRLKYYLAPDVDLEQALAGAEKANPDDEITDARAVVPMVRMLAESEHPVDEEALLSGVQGASRADLRALELVPGVEFEDTTEARVRLQTMTLVARTMTPVEKHLGDKQRRIIEFIEQHGETGYDELRELYGVGRQTLRSLEKRKLITTREEERYRDPFRNIDIERRAADPQLTDEQDLAVQDIKESIDAREFRPTLLEGVTGSGKTEVYLRAIRHVRMTGRTVLVLLPEISLTPQFVRTMRAALDEEIAVLHSQLTPGEKADTWRRLLKKELRVVIGARSALFAPLDNLGLIVIDEEHDSSFKQHEGVRYHARDAATVLASFAKIPIVLGSATPSLETWQNAREGKFRHIAMRNRVHQRPLPEIDYIDRKENASSDGTTNLITEPLQAAVKEAIDHGEQAILFLNRRGFAPSVVCKACGESIDCEDCDISLTYHQRGNVVRCHYCGDSHGLPERCPHCGAAELTFEGVGTEKVESVVEEAFPGARIARLDRDSARGKKLHEIIRTFREREADILVGTQMVTKGHDFHDVTVVGVLSGDQSLGFPDLRSGERTFQLLTQVAGRAGRGTKTGRVIVQSWKPEHHVHQAVRDADFPSFAVRELRERARYNYPPFGHLALIRFRSKNQSDLLDASEQLGRYIADHAPAEVDVIGPVESPLGRVRQEYRRQLLLRSRTRAPLHQAVDLAIHLIESDTKTWNGRRVRVSVDIDPISML